MTTIESYKTKAKDIFDAIKGDFDSDNHSFPGSSNYWQAGCVFDTLLDYMLLALGQKLDDKDMITQEDVKKVMEYVSANYDIKKYSYPIYYPHAQSVQGNWYDDFGWWGIASAKAYSTEYLEVFGDTAAKFKDIAQSCWNIMNAGKPGTDQGAPNVWENCDKLIFSSVEPRFPGGVWQYDITVEDNPIPVITKGQIKGPIALGPYQNTVVNGLYFVLGLRVPATEISIQPVYKFLTTWCFDAGNKIAPLLFTQDNISGLVLERISTYKNGSDVYPESWRAVDTAWCGDQGLILGAMVGYLCQFPTDKDANRLMETILSGVPVYMTQNNIIQPWYPCNDSNPLAETDKSDYASGIGVFMRYLWYAYNNNQYAKNAIETKTSGLSTMLFASAEACVQGKLPGYGNALFDSFNQLSTLTTAIGVLSTESKTGSVGQVQAQNQG